MRKFILALFCVFLTALPAQATFIGNLQGNATTASALAANPDDCASNTFAITIAANGNLTCAAASEGYLSFTDVTTANATTSAHGLLPKLSNNSGQFLNGTGSWSVPSGSGDVLGPATNNDAYVPVWNGVNSKTLANGYVTDASGACGASSVCLGGHTHDVATLLWAGDWKMIYSDADGLQELSLGSANTFLKANGDAAPTWNASDGTGTCGTGSVCLGGHTHPASEVSDATATPTASKIPIADGSGKLDGWVSLSSYLPLAGGTLTGQLITDNLGIEFEESDTNPTCAAGNYSIYADLSEGKFKKCVNGSSSDLDTQSAGSATAWDDIADPDADATIAFAGYEQDITTSLDAAGKTALTITNTDADRANATTILSLADNDGGDAEATYLSMIGTAGGTPTNDFIFNQSTGFTSLLPINPPAEAYDATNWDSDTGAPQKDAVRDKIETLATLASPTFTGDPLAPTASADDSDTSIATTAFVQQEIKNDVKTIAGFTISNGDTAISASVTDPVACQRIAKNSQATAWYINCDQSGSIVLDVWKNTWDDTPEANTDSIAGTEKPTLSSDVSASDTSLGSMTTDWNAGDNVCIEIESASTVTKCWLQFVGYND